MNRTFTLAPGEIAHMLYIGFEGRESGTRAQGGTKMLKDQVGHNGRYGA